MGPWRGEYKGRNMVASQVIPSHRMGVIVALIAAAVLRSAWAEVSPLDRLGNAVYDVVSSCPLSDAEECTNQKILGALGRPRSHSEYPVVDRLGEIMKSNQVVLELPELFHGARLLFRPGRGMDFDVEFPRLARSVDPITEQARSMMKDKMLMPLLMMIKMKLKLLTPILLTVVGIKAMKALVLSKMAFVLVMGFLVVQICQKLGMAKMSMMPAAPAPDPTPLPMYGAPTTSSYDPSGWEPAGGPYSRVYQAEPAQQMAYSSYAPQTSATFKH